MLLALVAVLAGAGLLGASILWPNSSSGTQEFGALVQTCSVDGDAVSVTGELVPGALRGDVWVHVLVAGADEPDLAAEWRAAASTGDRTALPAAPAAGVWVRDIADGSARSFELQIAGTATEPVSCTVVEILTPG